MPSRCKEHRIFKIKKTTGSWMWRCMDCPWFIHEGNARILLRMKVRCTECGNSFVFGPWNFEEEHTKCSNCKERKSQELAIKIMEELLKVGHTKDCWKYKMASSGENPDENDCTCGLAERRTLPLNAPVLPVIKQHAPECDTWFGRACDCSLRED